MKFDRPQTVSFKPVPEGEYIGVLVGFCYVGLHNTADWGPREKCMLRWELHDMNPPHNICVDEERLIHVVSQQFPATIRGDSSWLHKCLVAHGIVTPGGGYADSKNWHGHVAKLKIEHAQGNKGGTFSNVVDIKPLDHPVSIVPKLTYEHWEPSDDTPPPIWAKFMIERSNDLYDRVHKGKSEEKDKPSKPEDRQEEPYNPPSRSSYDSAPAGIDDDDIPFVHPYMSIDDDIEWIGLKWKANRRARII
jgi:hypothetical protein